MYLVLRRQKWWAMHDIPKSLHDVLGTRFAESLGTSDKKEAERRAAVLKARWLRELATARQKSPAGLEDEAAFWKRLIRSSNSEEEREAHIHELAQRTERKVQRLLDNAGFNDYADGWDEVPGVEEALRIKDIATGALLKSDEHLEEYLSTLGNEAKTVDMKRSTIQKFCQRFPYLPDIQRKDVQKWVNGQIQDGKAIATVRRSLSEMRGYWAYLQSIEVVGENVLPFEKLSLPKASQKARSEDDRRPFEAADVVKLLTEAENKGDGQLADLIRLGMWTGARIEELCSLKVSQVGEGFLSIEDAKTEAGIRKVPVHTMLTATVDRLSKSSADGFLLSGLQPNKYGDRSNALGKRFGRLKSALGFTEAYVFHSIRKTVATLLENAGVPENVAADIIGHDKPTLTYGLYSGGASLQTKREALEKIEYPSAQAKALAAA